MSFIERATLVLCLESTYLDISGEDPNEYSSALQVCPFRVVVSTDWPVPGQGIISPDVSHGITCPVLLLFGAWS